jgi:hypothetical protein
VPQGEFSSYGVKVHPILVTEMCATRGIVRVM